MKIIPSRELAASPGKVWGALRKEGSVVITKDGKPRGILLSTSDETLVEDIQDYMRNRAQRAVSEIRRESAKTGLNRITMKEIDEEVLNTRRERHSKQHSS